MRSLWTGTCRRNIRKTEGSDMIVAEPDDPDFVDDYHAQWCDVFAKQGGGAHVRRGPRAGAGQLRAPAGRCIATGIFPPSTTPCSSGRREPTAYLIERPNEVIQSYAMRYWKARDRVLRHGRQRPYK
jgi:hypothetical protein